MNTHLNTQIIDAPNPQAALTYAKKEASHYFSTDTAEWKEYSHDWELFGGESNEYRAHLRRAHIHRVGNNGMRNPNNFRLRKTTIRGL